MRSTMIAGRNIKRIAVASALALSIAACSGAPEFTPAFDGMTTPIVTSDEVPEIEWDKVRTVHWLLADYAISPSSPTFTSGTAYRLVIRNTGLGTHTLDAPDLYAALAIKSVKMSTFAGHTGDNHVDEFIGSRGLKGVPELPEIIEVEDADDAAADSANPFAADAASEGDDMADPFAEKPADREVAVEDAAPVDENAAPEQEVAVDDEPLPEADAAPEQEAAADDKPLSEDEPAKDEKVEVAEDDAAAPTADAVTPPAEDEKVEVADDDAVTPPTDDSEDMAKDDSDVDSDAAGDQTAESAEAWTPLQISEISVDPGHETTVEFVAIRPGRYGLSSADTLATIFGMFTLATIEPPVTETTTAAVEASD